MNDKTSTQEKANTEKPSTPPAEGGQASSRKGGKKTSEGTGRGRNKSKSASDLKLEAIEVLVKLTEGGSFHLSYETPEGVKDNINCWN